MLLLLVLFVILATALSVQYATYLDTSNALTTQQPHPLQNTHYFASKSTLLNTIFLKRAWAWTSAVSFAHLFTSPVCTYRARRIAQYMLATCCWLLVAQGIGGPSLIEHVAIATGGQCVLHLPPPHLYIILPNFYCRERIRVSFLSHSHLLPAPLTIIPAQASDETWSSIPRIRNGHDISGHIFLLTLSIMVLFDHLTATARRKWTLAHMVGVMASAALLLTWLVAVGTTSLYFHSPLEKISGLCE
ncbi:hypothetical protein BV25DRAFT_1813107 [Artomyces pyxidatus]|uniref:Uncharacterized protein n=1 Tax=Artomyces pyxidatus TaxID=48021 RepID=A0ACB8SL87_9AGAM|nr:hypothetical protein BV25DRAFT_1813107 [Artomyces pyxidatus]